MSLDHPVERISPHTNNWTLRILRVFLHCKTYQNAAISTTADQVFLVSLSAYGLILSFFGTRRMRRHAAKEDRRMSFTRSGGCFRARFQGSKRGKWTVDNA